MSVIDLDLNTSCFSKSNTDICFSEAEKNTCSSDAEKNTCSSDPVDIIVDDDHNNDIVESDSDSENEICNEDIIIDEPNKDILNRPDNIKKVPTGGPAHKQYTKLCESYGSDHKCNRKICTYAHTREQLRPIKCFNNMQCKNQNCRYFHDNDNMDIYLEKNINFLIENNVPFKPPKIIKFTTSSNIMNEIPMILASGVREITFIITYV